MAEISNSVSRILAESGLKTPCYIIDEAALIRNLEILAGVEKRTGCKILLAQKAFSCYLLYPLIGKYVSGTACSGLFEARLGAEEMGKENHVFSAAYRESEIDEIIANCGHIIFNSFTQLDRYRGRVLAAGKKIDLRPMLGALTAGYTSARFSCEGSGGRFGTAFSHPLRTKFRRLRAHDCGF